ncbi:MAG: hypothetical protein U0703_18855 [Anaerolineae bacterium]
MRGQSIAAIFKWIGTAAPTIQFYAQTSGLLILTFGLRFFFFDVVYIVLLRQKFREAGAEPFTGKRQRGTVGGRRCCKIESVSTAERVCGSRFSPRHFCPKSTGS